MTFETDNAYLAAPGYFSIEPLTGRIVVKTSLATDSAKTYTVCLLESINSVLLSVQVSLNLSSICLLLPRRYVIQKVISVSNEPHGMFVYCLDQFSSVFSLGHGDSLQNVSAPVLEVYNAECSIS